MRSITGACLLLLTASAIASGCGPGEEEYQRLEAHANEVLEDARSGDDAWRAGVTASMTQPPGGQCEPSVAEVGPQHIENFTETQLEHLAASHTAHFARVESWVSTHSLYFDGHIDLDQESIDRMHRELDAFEPYDHEIVMVERSSVRPVVNAGGYSGGSFDGRLVVWNVAEGRVECAADVAPGVIPNTLSVYADDDGGYTGAARTVYGALVSASTSQAWERVGLGERPPLGSVRSYRR